MMESSARWALISSVPQSRFAIWLVCQEFLSQDFSYLVPVWLWGRCGWPAFCPHLNKFNHAVMLVAFLASLAALLCRCCRGFELAAPLSERWFRESLLVCVCVSSSKSYLLLQQWLLPHAHVWTTWSPLEWSPKMCGRGSEWLWSFSPLLCLPSWRRHTWCLASCHSH